MSDAAKEARAIAQRLVRIHGFEKCADHLVAIVAEIEPLIQRRMEAEERRSETVAMCAQLEHEIEQWRGVGRLANDPALSWKVLVSDRERERDEWKARAEKAEAELLRSLAALQDLAREASREK